MIKKWIIRFISIAILCLFMFSAVSSNQITDNQQVKPVSSDSALCSLFSSHIMSSTSSTSFFHNIGYEICENNGLIQSIGLCMEARYNHTSSFSSTSLIISNYDEQGNFLFDQIFSLDDFHFMTPIALDDGNYVACGNVYDQYGSSQLVYPFLIKLNTDLEIIWQKEFSFFPNSLATSVCETSDDGFMVAGQMSTDQGTDDEKECIILIKTDETGNVTWKKTVEFDGLSMLQTIIQTNDEGFVLAGICNHNSSDPINSDIFVMKTDNNGVIEWKKILDYSRFDYATDLLINEDKVILVGFIANQTSPFDYGYHGLMCCLEKNGQILWNHHEQFKDRLFYGIKKIDEGYILTGSETNTSCGLLLKVDESGLIDWEVTTCGIANCCGIDVEQIHDDLFCFTGYTLPDYDSMPDFQYSQMITVGVDDQGEKQWEQVFAPSTDLTCEFQKKPWTIQNTGDVGAYNLSVELIISGNIVIGPQTQDEHITHILPGEKFQIDTPFLFGLGKITITLKVTGLNIEPINISLPGFLLGPFFFPFYLA